MDYDKILLFPAVLLFQNKYDIREHEIKIVFNSIAKELNREEFSIDLLDCLLFEYNMDLFSDMNEVYQQAVANLLIFNDINSTYCEYLINFVKVNTALLSSCGNITLDIWKKHKDLFIKDYLCINNKFLTYLQSIVLSEIDIENLHNYFVKDCPVQLFWDYISKSQELSEEFMIKNIKNISINYLEDNSKINRSVIDRIISLKKVIG